MILIMGIVEGGLFMSNKLGVGNTVRAGARSASAAGAHIRADLYTVFSMSQESAAVPRSAMEYKVIYKATGYGEGPVLEESEGVPGLCRSGIAVAGQCNVYRVADFAKAQEEVAERTRHAQALQTNPADVLDISKVHFGCQASSPDNSWCPADRADRTSSNGGLGPDYVGVYMKVKHDWITNMFGSTSSITDQSVIKIEPRQL